MKYFEATIKEKGHDSILTSSYCGDVDKEFLVKFWGLNNDDVEWYELIENDV